MECVYPSARAVAPEDLKRGVYVALLSMVVEESPLIMAGDWAASRPELARFAYLPSTAAPMRVSAVSLPYVLVEMADGEHWTLDVRRYRLAMLPARYGRLAFGKLRGKKGEKKGKSKKK